MISRLEGKIKRIGYNSIEEFSKVKPPINNCCCKSAANPLECMDSMDGMDRFLPNLWTGWTG
jgi:hypothetical protein